MKRKLLIIFLSIVTVVCLAFGISACSSSSETTTTPTSSTQSSSSGNSSSQSGESSDSSSSADSGSSATSSTESSSSQSSEEDSSSSSSSTSEEAHVHELQAVEAVTATCTEDGNIAYWYCKKCGKYYSDANATTEITLADTVIVASHTYGSEYERDENSHWQVCTECGEKAEAEAHTFDENNICTVCGYEYLEASVGLEYTLSDDEKYYSVSGIGECADTDIVIASVYNNLPVTAVAESAFSVQTQIISVYVPDSVVYFGAIAFEGCTSLTSVYYSGTASQWASITFENMFSNPLCFASNLYLDGALVTDITLENITKVNAYAFLSCSSLTSITIGESITSIGNYAFYGCKSITEINFNATAMDGKSSNNYVFDYAGQNSSGITVNIGANVTSIPQALFSPVLPTTTNVRSHSPKIISVVFEDNSKCESIGNSSFYYCTYITSINIPDSVTSIEGNAFSNCEGLVNVTLGSSLTSIGGSAFYYCVSLKNIVIPNSVKSIGESAFSGCYSLASISLPFTGKSTAYQSNSNTSLFGYIFGTSSYTGGTAVQQYYSGTNYTTYYIPTKLTSVTITDTRIKNYAFYNCTLLESITIADSVTTIGTNAFSYCTALESVYYSGTASQWASISFSDNPLSYADNLYLNGILATNITLEGITLIESSAFSGCTSITSVTISDSVTSIGSSAFYKCSSLTRITIPDSITSIDNDMFYNCTSLTRVYYIGTASQWASISFKNAYANPLYYAGKLYLNETLATDITIEGITIIRAYAFYKCSSLTSITIPDSVTSIGNYAFNYCNSLTSVYYTGTADEWSGISIGSNNTKLTSATIYYYAKNDGSTTATGNYWYYDENDAIVTWTVE